MNKVGNEENHRTYSRINLLNWTYTNLENIFKQLNFEERLDTRNWHLTRKVNAKSNTLHKTNTDDKMEIHTTKNVLVIGCMEL